jgi:hypothetical protein
MNGFLRLPGGPNQALEQTRDSAGWPDLLVKSGLWEAWGVDMIPPATLHRVEARRGRGRQVYLPVGEQPAAQRVAPP